MLDALVKRIVGRWGKLPLGQVVYLLGPTDATFIATLRDTDGTRAVLENSISLRGHCPKECAACIRVRDVAVVAWGAGGGTGAALARLECRGFSVIHASWEPIHGQSSRRKDLPLENNESLFSSNERNCLDTQDCGGGGDHDSLGEQHDWRRGDSVLTHD
jgi:hypothetical protein